VARIAAERGDMVVNPLESSPLIEEHVISDAGTLGGERSVTEKPERTEPIAGSDDDRAGLGGKVLAVLRRVIHRGGDKRPRVEPDDHRRGPRGRWIWRPDVELQTIFAAHRLTIRRVQLRTRERRDRRTQDGRRPGRGGLRRFPSKVAGGRRRER